MAFTTAMLDQLVEAYARGATSVGHGDKKVAFASGDDLLKRIRIVAAALGVDLNLPKYRRTLAQHNRCSS